MIEGPTKIAFIVLDSLWSIIILMLIYNNLTRWSKFYLPLEAAGKISIVTAHMLLLISIWMTLLFNIDFVIWIIIFAMAITMLVIWTMISRIQDRYVRDKLKEVHDKFEKELKKEKSFTRVVRGKNSVSIKRRRRRRKRITW